MNCILHCDPSNAKHQALRDALEKRGYKVELRPDFKELRLEYLGRIFYAEEISLHFFCGNRTWQNQN